MRRLYLESVTHKIERAVAINVGKHRPHRRGDFTILAVGHAEIAGNFFEGAVVLVVKQKIFGFIVRDVNVGLAVAVKIRRSHAHGAALISADAGFVRHVGEGAVAVVVIETIGIAGIVERPRIVIGCIEGAILGIELHVTTDEQIDAAVAVVIQPSRTDRPSIDVDSGLGSYVRERTVAIVVVKDGLAVAGDEEVDEAVVVEIGGNRRQCHKYSRQPRPDR